MKDGELLTEDFSLCPRVDWAHRAPWEGVWSSFQIPQAAFCSFAPALRQEAGSCHCTPPTPGTPQHLQWEHRCHRAWVKCVWVTLSFPQLSVVCWSLLLLWCTWLQNIGWYLKENYLWQLIEGAFSSSVLFTPYKHLKIRAMHSCFSGTLGLGFTSHTAWALRRENSINYTVLFLWQVQKHPHCSLVIARTVRFSSGLSGVGSSVFSHWFRRWLFYPTAVNSRSGWSFCIFHTLYSLHSAEHCITEMDNFCSASFPWLFLLEALVYSRTDNRS